jgi:hypothetical protein
MTRTKNANQVCKGSLEKRIARTMHVCASLEAYSPEDHDAPPEWRVPS